MLLHDTEIASMDLLTLMSYDRR